VYDRALSTPAAAEPDAEERDQSTSSRPQGR
jgi:hypothetical protein